VAPNITSHSRARKAASLKAISGVSARQSHSAWGAGVTHREALSASKRPSTLGPPNGGTAHDTGPGRAKPWRGAGWCGAGEAAAGWKLGFIEYTGTQKGFMTIIPHD